MNTNLVISVREAWVIFHGLQALDAFQEKYPEWTPRIAALMAKVQGELERCGEIP